MKNKITKTAPNTRWHVAFEDSGYWRTGIYKPECNSVEEIQELEKHTCPELFLCCGGKMGLLVSDGSNEEIIHMEPGEAIELTEYHNGFAVDPEGYFFVVERTDFSTEYMDRKNREIIRRVTVSSSKST
ncbi:MAG: hypothetical protein GY754_23775 [bacterium]|nr:hypothetical protein [bacterium]